MSRTKYLRVKVLFSISKPIPLHTLHVSDMSEDSSINMSISDLSEFSLPDSFLSLQFQALGFLVLADTFEFRLLPYRNATAFF